MEVVPELAAVEEATDPSLEFWPEKIGTPEFTVVPPNPTWFAVEDVVIAPNPELTGVIGVTVPKFIINGTC